MTSGHIDDKIKTFYNGFAFSEVNDHEVFCSYPLPFPLREL